jgi:hypothetical protein
MFKSYYVNVQKLCLSIAKSYVCRSVEAMRVDVEKLCLMMSVRMFMYAYVYNSTVNLSTYPHILNIMFSCRVSPLPPRPQKPLPKPWGACVALCVRPTGTPNIDVCVEHKHGHTTTKTQKHNKTTPTTTKTASTITTPSKGRAVAG